MNEKGTIQDELNGINSTLGHCDTPYCLTPDYFDDFFKKILARVQEPDTDSVDNELHVISSVLAHVPRTNPYTVPQSYSVTNTSLSVSVKEVIERSKELSVPYDVPPGFFDNFPKKVISLLGKENTSGIHFSIVQPKKWLRYGWAAIIAGLLLTTGLTWYQSSIAIDPVQKPYAWMQKTMKKVSTDDLSGFIDMASAEDKTSTTSINNATHEQVKELLNTVSEKDVEQFLQEVESLELN